MLYHDGHLLYHGGHPLYHADPSLYHDASSLTLSVTLRSHPQTFPCTNMNATLLEDKKVVPSLWLLKQPQENC